MLERFFDSRISPEYQTQLDELAESLAVKGINKVALENSLYRAVDTGHMTAQDAEQTLEDFREAFKV